MNADKAKRAATNLESEVFGLKFLTFDLKFLTAKDTDLHGGNPTEGMPIRSHAQMNPKCIFLGE